jgi:L-glyceraldehyde 3-phosphate reductase
MFVRDAEEGLLDLLQKTGVGCIAFSPLAQGLLTDKYLNNIPAGSRVGRSLPNGAITEDALSQQVLSKIRQLNIIAKGRGQSLAQMALAWVLKDDRITSVILGVSKPQQIEDALKCLKNIEFDMEELLQIDKILSG